MGSEKTKVAKDITKVMTIWKDMKQTA
jgi:hypothetical protein